MKFSCKFYISDRKEMFYVSFAQPPSIHRWAGSLEKEKRQISDLIEIRKILYFVIEYHKKIERFGVMKYSINTEK